MDPITMALIMGGAGLAKGELIDRPKEDRQRHLAAETQRYSPWTGLRAQPVQEADPFGSALQGGATGLTFGQGLQNYESDKKLKDAQTNWLNSGGAPQYTAAMSNTGNPWKLGNYSYY